jgi:hypothetical protein
MRSVQARKAGQLKGGFKREIILPGDGDYDSARGIRGWLVRYVSIHSGKEL